MSKVIGYVTTMQYAAMTHAAERKLAPGCSSVAQYHRLRRAAIQSRVDPFDPGSAMIYCRRTIQITDTTTHPWSATVSLIASTNADRSAPFVDLVAIGAKLYGSASATTHTLTWSNGTTSTMSLLVRRCCNAGGGCGEGNKLVDARGKTCCVYPYCELLEACQTNPPVDGAPLVGRHFVRVSEAAGYYVLSNAGIHRLVRTVAFDYCQLPDGATLHDVDDVNLIRPTNDPGVGEITLARCNTYVRCDESGAYAQDHVIATAPRVVMQTPHTLWSGGDLTCPVTNPDPRPLWDGTLYAQSIYEPEAYRWYSYRDEDASSFPGGDQWGWARKTPVPGRGNGRVKCLH